MKIVLAASSTGGEARPCSNCQLEEDSRRSTSTPGPQHTPITPAPLSAAAGRSAGPTDPLKKAPGPALWGPLSALAHEFRLRAGLNLGASPSLAGLPRR